MPHLVLMYQLSVLTTPVHHNHSQKSGYVTVAGRDAFSAKATAACSAKSAVTMCKPILCFLF